MPTKEKMATTMQLVENRVKAGTSPDLLKDMSLLTDLYTANEQWEKANAVSQQMIAVAEDNQSTGNARETSHFSMPLFQTIAANSVAYASRPKPKRNQLSIVLVVMELVALSTLLGLIAHTLCKDANHAQAPCIKPTIHSRPTR